MSKKITRYGLEFTCTCEEVAHGEAVTCQWHGSTDPETKYFSSEHVATDFGPDARCCRCGGRGLWGITGEENKANPTPEMLKHLFCLRCADEWSRAAGHLFEKHGYKDGRSSDRKWQAARQEFLDSDKGTFDAYPNAWERATGRREKK